MDMNEVKFCGSRRNQSIHTDIFIHGIFIKIISDYQWSNLDASWIFAIHYLLATSCIVKHQRSNFKNDQQTTSLQINILLKTEHTMRDDIRLVNILIWLNGQRWMKGYLTGYC